MNEILLKIFYFYDGMIGAFPAKAQILVSLILILLIISSIIGLLRHGHWIFALIFIILFPGAWPASLIIADAIWLLLKFLFVRIQINI